LFYLYHILLYFLRREGLVPAPTLVSTPKWPLSAALLQVPSSHGLIALS